MDNALPLKFVLKKSMKNYVTSLVNRIRNIEGKPLMAKCGTMIVKPLNDIVIDKPRASNASDAEEVFGNCLTQIMNTQFNDDCIGNSVNVTSTNVVGAGEVHNNSVKGDGVFDQANGVATSIVKTNNTPSFAKVLQGNPYKKVVKIQELWNSEDEIKYAPLWVKLHHVPIMAYSEVGNTYARALIEISAKEELKKSMVISILLSKGNGHTFANINIEYEWTPPRCATCIVFDHVNDKCPKCPKVDALMKDLDEGFTVVKKKNAKTKHNQKTRQVEGNAPTLKKPYTHTDDNVVLKNTFSVLTDDEDAEPCLNNFINDDNDCEEVDEDIVLDDRHGLRQPVITTKGVGTPVVEILIFIDYALLFFVIEIGPLMERGVIRMEKKELFCSFMYAHNHYNQRRALWKGLGHHKLYVRDRSWCLLRDFNATLFLDDSIAGSSNIDIAMREFKECVDDIEIILLRFCVSLRWLNPNLSLSSSTTSLLSMIGLGRLLMGCGTISSAGSTCFEVKKLKYLKKPLRKLLYGKGNLHANVVRLHNELDHVQTILDNDTFNSNLCEAKATCVVKFNQAVIMKERFLKQKTKIHWLKENSSYFHKAVKSRVSRSRIDVVTNGEGMLFANDKFLDAFVSHYEAFLGRPVVKEAMFSIGDDKSPGHDGYTAKIFKDAWDIVGNDVTKAICEFFYEWRVMEAGDFTYHRYCSILELINLYFADDLFLFAYGVVQSASIIKEALDEFKYALGDDARTSLWIDRRCEAGPIANYVSTRDMFCLGLRLTSKVKDVLHDDALDSLEWCKGTGISKAFSVSQVWSSIRPRDVKVPWFDMVWFASGIPHHAFTLWLIVKRKLKTQDRVCAWDASDSLGTSCSLCKLRPDSHEYLFFECSFAQSVWCHMKRLDALDLVAHDIYAIIDHIGTKAKRRTTPIVIAKLVVAASAYFIWQERNRRLFKNTKRSLIQVIE
uniref:Reverse transcriptase zinc-binding domain-containing protein n=1 Tax=Tanacetum cinerariifolium TaxID=118510 RepID=A0A699GMK5_TANCI|nr:hypothetical protein [Tanacetum cinerariifolium]GEV38736.1 hypothetical protein [Tanacetum cinerariifolium]